MQTEVDFRVLAQKRIASMLSDHLDAPISQSILSKRDADAPIKTQPKQVNHRQQFLYDWGKQDAFHLRQIDKAKTSNFIDFMHQKASKLNKRS